MLRRFAAAAKFHASARQLRILPFKLADIGEGIAEVEIIQWFVKEGDTVAQFDPVCEVQSDKAAVEISSRYDGKIAKIYPKVGEMAKVGSTLVDIDSPDDDSHIDAPPATPQSPPPADPSDPKRAATSAEDVESVTFLQVLATPAVRRLSREARIDLSLVAPGSGKDGRILKEDVQAFIDASSSASSLSNPPTSHTTTTNPSPAATDHSVPLTVLQKAMFKEMTRSLSIPHFGYSDSIDVTQASTFRASINAHLASRSAFASSEINQVAKISHLAIFIKALSLSLLDFPIMNARLDTTSDAVAIVYRAKHNIGVAIDTPSGLVVPSIKDVASLSILGIAGELERLRLLSKTGKLGPADLSGTTITLSNIGNIGGSWLHPVIVQGQVAIGAIGSISRVPVFQKDPLTGEEVVRPIEQVSVSFSADHRVIDGASMARFVNTWKAYIEDPATMAARI